VKSSTPKKIKKLSPGELMIVWADGKESHYLAPRLRGMCPCASCKDEMTGIRIVGQYALQFEWSDGHRTGIYTFEYLRELGE
jgi:DUF971 family protein